MNKLKLHLEVIQEDNRLDRRHQSSLSALCEHRWHWTLDETNPERVSLAEYARQVGRASSTINTQAHGFAFWVDAGRPDSPSLTDFIVRANMGEEFGTVIETIAQARGQSYRTTREQFSGYARVVASQARQIVANDPSLDYRDAVRQLVNGGEDEVLTDELRAEKQEMRRNVFRHTDAIGAIYRGRQATANAIELVRNVQWTDEEHAQLADAVAKFAAAVGLLEVAILGSKQNINWDAELAKLNAS